MLREQDMDEGDWAAGGGEAYEEEQEYAGFRGGLGPGAVVQQSGGQKRKRLR